MLTELKTEKRRRSFVVIDIESAVLGDAGHNRYLAMERRTPKVHDSSGSTSKDAALRFPRWVFQTIVTASAMVLTEHDDGNVDVTSFVTFSAPDHSEKEVVAGLLKVFADAPAGAELASWGASMHDIPLLVCACMRHGLTLPPGWTWMSFGGDGRNNHLDLSRVLTGGFKIKQIHMSEYAAALNLPAKMSVAPFLATKLIYEGAWGLVQEACEGDVITTALLLARWKRLQDRRAEAHVAEDRILRRVIELRDGRGYVGELKARRAAAFKAGITKAANDAHRLAPWLDKDAA
jgi:3'-5' exonuclease